MTSDDMVMVPRELLFDLRCYGDIHTVEGVLYGRSHRDRLREANDILAASAPVPPSEPVFEAAYDKSADVLYLTVKHADAIAEEGPPGFIWRRDPDTREIVGLTIMDFSTAPGRFITPSEPVGWFPIETAPKDRPLLLWWRTCSHPSVGEWSIDDGFEIRPRGWTSPEFGWRSEGDQCIPRNQADCTHWMPLPPSPGNALTQSNDKWFEKIIADARAERERLVAQMERCDYLLDAAGMPRDHHGEERPLSIDERVEALCDEYEELQWDSGGDVSREVYEAAVRGRREFRQLFRDAKEQLDALTPSGEIVEVLRKLRLTARVLLQNSDGCAVNHYGHDYITHGRPGWLADCEKDIERAEAALAKMEERS